MRLDQYLSEELGSRTRAADAIKAGRVRVNQKTVLKPGFALKESDQVEWDEAGLDFVSRAGHKLEAAIEAFSIPIENLTAADIGASTGGFTQCLLMHGAKKIYAIDVGHLQLSKKLQEDSRIVKMEGTNAKEIRADWFEEPVDFVCMDVSFISCLQILEPLLNQFVPASMVVLVKPQFETLKSEKKNGIVRSEKARVKALDKVKQFLKQFYSKVSSMESPLPGREGNVEYLVYCFNPLQSTQS